MKEEKESKWRTKITLISISLILIIASISLTGVDLANITGFAIFEGKEITENDFENIRADLEIPHPDEQISLSSNILNLKGGEQAALIVRFLNPAKGSIATNLKIEGEEDFFIYDKEKRRVEINGFSDWDVKVIVLKNAEAGEYVYEIKVGGRSSRLIIVVEE